MPTTLQEQDMRDLVTGTLRNYGPPRFKQIATELQSYEVMPKWFKRDKVMIQGGTGLKRTLMARTNRTAYHTGIAGEDVTSITDLFEQIDVPFRHAVASWSYITQQVLVNRGKELVVNVIKPKRTAAMIDMAEELEYKAWAAPTPDNDVDPYGIPWWIVKNATQGFNGGYPTGFSTMAGINLDTVPNFKNWTDTYVAISKQDLVKKLRRMLMYCGWKSPLRASDMLDDKAMYRFYCNFETELEVNDVATAQNDNLGPDVTNMDGQAMIKRFPLVAVPALNTHTDNPIYAVDHNCFYPFIRQGDFLRETGMIRDANRHNVWHHFIDLGYNYIMINRRTSGVLYQV
jgi:hypothetical protein